MSKNRNHDAAFKAKVALEAVKGEKTVAQIGREYGVHPNLVSQWRKQMLSALPSFFSDKRKRLERDVEAAQNELYQQIGQLKVENEGLKKKSLLLPLKEKRDRIEEGHRLLSVRRQCALMELSRASYYRLKRATVF